MNTLKVLGMLTILVGSLVMFSQSMDTLSQLNKPQVATTLLATRQ